MKLELLAQAANLQSKIEGCEHALEQVTMPNNVTGLRITLYTDAIGEEEKINFEHQPSVIKIRSFLIDLIGDRLNSLKEEAEALGEEPCQALISSQLYQLAADTLAKGYPGCEHDAARLEKRARLTSLAEGQRQVGN